MGCSSSKSSKKKSKTKVKKGIASENDVEVILGSEVSNDSGGSSKSRKSRSKKHKSRRSGRGSEDSWSSENSVEDAVLKRIRARKAVYSKSYDESPIKGMTNGKSKKKNKSKKKAMKKSKKEESLILKALGKCYLFSDVSSDQLKKLVSLMWRESVPVGTTVIKEGKKSRSSRTVSSSSSEDDCFYIIESGTFEFTVGGKQVGTRSYKSSTPYFGELALVFNAPRGATATCTKGASSKKKSPAVLWAIDRNTFRQTLISSSKKIRNDNRKALAKIPLLKDNLSSSQLDLLAETVQTLKMKEGQRIVKKGQRGDVCFFIKEGTVACSKIGHNNMGKIQLGAGQYFGERALLTDEPRAADVVAKTPVTLLGIDRRSFNELLGSLRSVMDENMKGRVIESVPILQEISKSVRKQVMGKFSMESFKDGEVIFEQGDSGSKFYIVRAGTVKVLSGKSSIATLTEGNWFGEMALINKEKRAATCRAVGAVECFTLSRDNFKMLSKACPLLIKTSKERTMEISKVNRGSRQRRKSSAGKPTLTKHSSSSRSSISTSFRSKRVASNIRELDRLKILGKGTFGTVHLVMSKDGRLWALKMMNKTHLVECEQTQNVLNEKLVLSQVNHPFILELMQTFQDHDSLYMLLEFVQGGELFSIMQDRFRLPVDDSRFYAACIIDAFDYLHNKSIVYRDLKPENVLIGRDGFVKMADFGFAKKITSKTYTLCGTPEYLAPEVVLCKGHDKGVDYWGIGVLIYEMLVGISPFADEYGEDQVTVCNNIVGSKVDYDKLLKSIRDIERGGGKKKSSRKSTAGAGPIPPVAKQIVDFVSKLLVKSPHQRLGCLRDGASGVKQHPFMASHFKDWSSLRDKKVDAPFIPSLSGPTDTSNFDEFEPDESWDEYRGSNDWCANF